MGGTGCGTASGWTKAIALIQMMGSILALTVYMIMLCRTQDVMDALKKYYTATQLDDREARELVILVISINMLLSCMTFAVAMVLYIGAVERKTIYINVWIVLRLALSGVDILAIILIGEYAGVIDGGSICQCVITICATIFGICIVTFFKQQLKADKTIGHSSGSVGTFTSVIHHSHVHGIGVGTFY